MPEGRKLEQSTKEQNTIYRYVGENRQIRGQETARVIKAGMELNKT